MKFRSVFLCPFFIELICFLCPPNGHNSYDYPVALDFFGQGCQNRCAINRNE